MSPEGILGVNLMVALNNYKEMVKAAVEEKIDLIISGAGLPTDLPALVRGSKTKIAPIVSSGKATALITKLWEKRFDYIPDLVIVEGPEAGGHLGFTMESLKNKEHQSLTEIIKDVIEALRPYREGSGKEIPVIAAGGIYSGSDVAQYLRLGAAGVQMGTRFVATEECDASQAYKDCYLRAEKENIQLVKSPVGMPGRAIQNEFIKRVSVDKEPINKCYQCLRPCKPAESLYCISTALIKAVEGDTDNGLIFTGSNAYRLKKIVKVKELLRELVQEAELALI